MQAGRISTRDSIVGRLSKMVVRPAVFAVFILLTAILPDDASAKYASIVVDANSGRILHGTNIDTRNYPASLTKMMTLYMVFDAIEEGNLTLETKLKVSRRAARQPASRLGLKRGHYITVFDAVMALVTKSANDVATAVAENLAGSERNFALQMTAKARKLGMNRTTFRNASGLPNRGQMSTARDMAKLARALLINHPRFYSYFSIKRYKYRGRTLKNHNKLLTTYEGADGIKTGYINAAGYNLVASAKRGEQRLIGVIFGGNSAAHRNRHMTRLLNKGFGTLGGKTAKPLVIADAPAPSPNAGPKQKDRKSPKWGVQVGAFARYAQAYEAARSAVDMAPSLLKDGHIKIVPLKKKSGRTLHRARVYGISKKQAYRTCRYLKKRRRHCMELQIKTPIQVADRGN